MNLPRNHYQRNSSWNAPYTFSGKEKDAETGYGYFGARYYDSGLSIWLSVDPMSDKYPSMSPYNYCANNPVMLVDLDGRDIINIASNGVISIKPQDGPDVIVFEKTGLKHNLDAHGVFDNKITTNKYGHQVISGFSADETSDFFNLFAANTRVEWGKLKYKDSDGNTVCFLGTSRDNNSEANISAMALETPSNVTDLRYDHSHYADGSVGDQNFRPTSYDGALGSGDHQFWDDLVKKHPTASAGILWNGDMTTYIKKGEKTNNYYLNQARTWRPF